MLSMQAVKTVAAFKSLKEADDFNEAAKIAVTNYV